jgi:DNA processing protein
VHRRLHARVAKRGCVVSELPPGFGAMRWCFVARNRIIAGLAEITVVVEATVRSGSLTTADFAANAGRQVAAVPGPVTSRLAEGTNGLIAAGAALVRDARDVLELLLGPGAVPDSVANLGRPGHRPAAPVTALEAPLRALLDAVEQGRGSLEALTPDAEAAPAILRGLTELERRGLIRRDFGGRYIRLP